MASKDYLSQNDLHAAGSGDDWPGIVHEHYMKMQMMLAES